MSDTINILVPLNNMTDIKRFDSAGADQFYFGFYDSEWEDLFGVDADINRMSSFGCRANRFDFKQALSAVKDISCRGRDSYITFNANVYSKYQVEFLKNRFELLKESGATGVILSDSGLLDTAKSIGLRAVASTMTGIYNSDILKYYINKGFERVILPRESSISDIAKMHELFPSTEIEVFFMRNGCIYSDSNCLINHRYGGICTDLRRREGMLKISSKSTVSREELEESIKLYNDRLYNKIACGQCALYELIKAGAKALKIVGRADNNDSVLKDIELTKANLEVAYNSSSKEEYLKRMTKPFYEATNCCEGFNCYYR